MQSDHDLDSQTKLAPIVSLVAPPGGFLLVFVFAKSSSKKYPLAVEMAKAAGQYAEREFEGSLLHGAGFTRDRSGAMKALALLKIAGGWRGAQVFAGAKGTVSVFNAMKILTCYLSGTAIGDPAHHCHVKFGAEVHPCRLIVGYTRRVYWGRPEDLEWQIKGLAVYRGVDWCPYFMK